MEESSYQIYNGNYFCPNTPFRNVIAHTENAGLRSATKETRNET